MAIDEMIETTLSLIATNKFYETLLMPQKYSFCNGFY